MQRKVFCIGLHRTGTTSLIEALKRFGFRIWHYNKNYSQWTQDILLNKKIDYSIFDNFDAFADIPVPFIYHKLDNRYPGSKFILTTRNEDDWLSSAFWMIEHSKKTKNKFDIKNLEIIYKNNHPLRVFRKHNKEVMKYFENQKNRLLICDIEKLTWSILSGFLEKDPAIISFPKLNVRTG